MTIQEKIGIYLAHGGLFNPEMMNPEEVRDLLIDARMALIVLEQSRDNWECAAKANDAVVAQLKSQLATQSPHEK